MKRYLLFGYNNYYPMGGWFDFIGQFDSIESAMSYQPTGCLDNLEIVDLEVGEVVQEASYLTSKMKYKWKESEK